MSERERPNRPDEVPGPSGLGNPFAMGGDANVTVEHGVYRESLPLGGRTVGEIRRIVGPRFDIGARAAAIVDGNVVGDDTVIQAGQDLRFMHHAGEKGQESLEDLIGIGWGTDR